MSNENTPLPEHYGTIHDDGYWLSNAKGPRKYDNLHAGWASKKVYTEDQVREILSAAAAPGKYDDVLKPFFSLMEKELHANSGKGDRPGWLAMTRQTAVLEIYYHTAKLQKAAKDDDADRIREYAADVANMAMMLVDVCVGIAPYTSLLPLPAAPALPGAPLCDLAFLKLQFFRDITAEKRYQILVSLDGSPDGCAKDMNHHIEGRCFDLIVKAGRVDDLRASIKAAKAER